MAASDLPFWGDTIGGYALAQPSTSQDPNWEAAYAQWSQWDTAIIGGFVVPGLVKVRARRRRRTQTSRTPGASGARLTSLGFDPAEIDFEITMWTANHLNMFAELVADIQDRIGRAMKSKNAKSELAIPVHHPGLSIYRISSLYFVEGTIPESHGGQVFMATLRFSEYYPITTGTRTVVAKGDNQLKGIPQVPISTPATTSPSKDPKASAP